MGVRCTCCSFHLLVDVVAAIDVACGAFFLGVLFHRLYHTCIVLLLSSVRQCSRCLVRVSLENSPTPAAAFKSKRVSESEGGREGERVIPAAFAFSLLSLSVYLIISVPCYFLKRPDTGEIGTIGTQENDDLDREARCRPP